MGELTEDQRAELDDWEREWWGYCARYRSPYNHDGSLGVEHDPPQAHSPQDDTLKGIDS